MTSVLNNLDNYNGTTLRPSALQTCACTFEHNYTAQLEQFILWIRK